MGFTFESENLNTKMHETGELGLTNVNIEIHPKYSIANFGVCYGYRRLKSLVFNV